MRKLSKNGTVRLGAALAVCALAMPGVASAASWGPLGTTHALDSPNFGFVAHTPIGVVTASCARSRFHTDVASAAVVTVTGVSFSNCTGGGAAGHCTLTETPTQLPWIMTGPTTNNVQIERLHVHVRFEPVPGTKQACALANQNVIVTGTATAGAFSNPGHEVVFSNAPGLTMHSALGASSATVSGTLFDTSATLTLT